MEFDQPCFNITSHAKVTGMVNEARRESNSLTLLSLYYVAQAANDVEAFRLRLEDGKVVRYDKIFPGSTVLHDDDSFGFAYFPHTDDKEYFLTEGRKIADRQKKEKSFSPGTIHNGLIHCSIIPWVKLTSFQHAKNSKGDHSIPKIVIGKIYQENNEYWMPISVEVHHALVDGLHVGKYFEVLEQLCNT